MSITSPVSAAAPRPTLLADALTAAWGPSSLTASRAQRFAKNATLVVAGALLVGVLAQVRIPLPLVPITGQTLGVLLVGSALGARRGAAAMVTYMLMGLAGLPVFSGFLGGPAAIAGPTFGFILGFIPAAALAGFFAERAWDRRSLRALAGFLAASAVPFLVGIPYLMGVSALVLGEPMGVATALAVGLVPFIPGGVVKAALAAILMPLAHRGVRKLER